MADARENYYLFGVFHYQDWFSEGAEYRTKFCFAIIPFREDGKLKVSYEPRLFWNCADDECDVDKAAYDAEVLNSKTP
jgi:hypothetical protein